YVKKEIPDYQASAFLMAIYLKGMSKSETANLTRCMAQSGDMVDLSKIEGIKVDKHSTGGVGDKTTLIVAPIVASCGVKVAKMSGRGLGHTGGTVDKLESINNFKISLSEEEFFSIVNEVGVSVIGQTGNIAPADKRLYALRDVTATIDCIPLIASSIMSKKIAAGSDCILLDVKTGSGAFMKTLDSSIELANEMVSIGESVGRKTIALITNMDIPLGNSIGNSLEVIEAVKVLKGEAENSSDDLTEVCINLAANMLYLAKKGTLEICTKMARDSIKSLSAFETFKKMVVAQGGDVSLIENTNNFYKAKYTFEVKSEKTGYITKMDTEKCGIASVLLGAGRLKKEDSIDYSAGIILSRKYGEAIKKGETIAKLFSNDESSFNAANELFLSAIKIEETKPKTEKL
ncbi:MAG: thymidine phosphorylase, partial [Oscillospiraceae bacterium]